MNNGIKHKGEGKRNFQVMNNQIATEVILKDQIKKTVGPSGLEQE